MSSDSSSQAAGWIDAALVEYEAHRAEVLAESQGQQQTLALGAAAIGVLIAGAINVWDDRLLATIIFLGVIPLLCVLVLIQWAGRAFGLMRVGVYLEGLEKALRTAYASAPAPVLSWEGTLASMRPSKWWKPHHEWSDFGSIAVFMLLAVGSIAIGSYRGYAGHEVAVAAFTLIQVTVVLFFTVILARNLATARVRARRDFLQPEEVRRDGPP